MLYTEINTWINDLVLSVVLCFNAIICNDKCMQLLHLRSTLRHETVASMTYTAWYARHWQPLVAFQVKQGQDDNISQGSPQSWAPKGQGCLAVTAGHFESSASCMSQVKMFPGTVEDNLWQEDKLFTCLSLQSQSPYLVLRLDTC